MRAAIYEEFGPAHDVLRVVELQRPEPGPGEVRVQMRASGVNPSDCRTRSGGNVPSIADFIIPNRDGAGVIDAAGQGVAPGRVGQRVWVHHPDYDSRRGTAAEWACLPCEDAVPLPSSAPFTLGAQLGIPALTAHECVFADGPVDGQTVLVAGGAGAVGHFAVELAVWGGATVITTVSSEEKADLARAAGAHCVVNYRSHDAAATIHSQAPEGVDRIIEVAPAANLELDLAVSARGARIVCFADDGPMSFAPLRLLQQNITLRFVYLYHLPRRSIDDGVKRVSEALAAEALTELPVRTFPLASIADAHAAVERGTVGRVVVALT